jgi:hypothetical protein
MPKQRPQLQNPKHQRRSRRPKPSYSTSMIQSISTIQNSTDSRIIRMVKAVDKGTVTGTAADLFGSITFTLNDLSEVTSITNLYDQYRIDKIDAYFLPLNQPVNSGVTALASGMLVTAVDYDDNGTPGSLAVVLNYDNVKVHPAGQSHTISFVPHIATAAYSGAFTSYANMSSQWIDAVSNTVVHYGLKYGVTGSTYWPVWRVICRYHISLKSSR